MKVFLKGLNTCQMRKGKLAQYQVFLEANGHTLVPVPEKSDVILIWTCSFRSDVRDNSIAEVLEYQKNYPSEVIVAGCLPGMGFDLTKQGFRGRFIHWKNDAVQMESVFGGGAALKDFPPYFNERSLCDNAAEYRQKHPEADVTFHDQFIKLLVSEGCNHQCSFCAEKTIFPDFRSFSAEVLEKNCRALVKQTGLSKIVLLADSLGDYGSDIGSSLPALIDRLKKIKPGLSFALNNLNPEDFIRHQDAFGVLIKEKTICHLNLPIQSASDRILKLMVRQYSGNDLEALFKRFKDLNFRDFDTHVIVGFPTETEEDFEKTLSLLAQVRPRYVLASVFMDIPGSTAHELPGKVAGQTIQARMRRLQRQMNAQGVICNAEKSLLIVERLKKINKK